MFRVRHGPPPLAGFDRLIFASQTTLEASITLGALLVTLFLLLFAATESVRSIKALRYAKSGVPVNATYLNT